MNRDGHHTVRGAWYEIQNATADVADLYVYDFIDDFGVRADDFRRDLDEITARQITLHVNSGGGFVGDGIAIYNIIRDHPAFVTAKVEGHAASIASVIVQAGDRRVMMKHSEMMIHDATAGTGFYQLNAREFRDLADRLDEASRRIAGIYHERTRGGQPKLDKIRKAMADETFFTAEEAVAFGLADAVEAPKFRSEPDVDEALEGIAAIAAAPGANPEGGVRDDGEPAADTVVDTAENDHDGRSLSAFDMLRRTLKDLEATS